MLSNRQNLGLLLGVSGMIVFAGSLPASRIAVADVTPYFLTAMRASIAGLAGLALLLATGKKFPPRETWRPLIVCAIAVVLGFPLLSALAMVTVPASHGGVILGILPLATTAAAAMIEGERPSAGFWIAALAGSALVMGFALYRSGGHSLSAGDLLLVGAVLCGGLGYTYSGQLAGSMPGWEVISWAVVLSLPLSLLGVWLAWPAEIGAISPRAWGAILYAGLMAQFIGFFLWNAAMARAGISRIGQIRLLQPVFVALIAMVFAGEPLDPVTLMFVVGVIAVVAIGTRLRVRRRAPKADHSAA